MPTEKQRLVLVVDDEDVVIQIFQETFAGQNEFVLDTAKTVDEALQKISVVSFDIVFLDMKLDYRFAGMKILREIVRLEIAAQSTGRTILKSFVVIMSGSVCFDDFMPEAYELGALCFIPKPVTFTPAFVRRALNRLGLPLLAKPSV